MTWSARITPGNGLLRRGPKISALTEVEPAHGVGPVRAAARRGCITASPAGREDMQAEHHKRLFKSDTGPMGQDGSENFTIKMTSHVVVTDLEALQRWVVDKIAGSARRR